MLPHFSPQKKKKNFGGQIDVAPTLLGMLRINYIQNNLGIDLLKEERPCMFFSADNMLESKTQNISIFTIRKVNKSSIIIFITEL